jgi:predicted nucleic acid-binding protein
MVNQIRVFLDTNVFLAHIKGELQGSHAKMILEKIAECRLTLYYNGIIRMEIERKYRYYSEPFCSMLDELRKLEKIVDVDITTGIEKDIARLDRKLAKSKGGRFGKVDCLLLLLAKKHKCIFVTSEKELLEAAKEEGIEAADPVSLSMGF